MGGCGQTQPTSGLAQVDHSAEGWDCVHGVRADYAGGSPSRRARRDYDPGCHDCKNQSHDRYVPEGNLARHTGELETASAICCCIYSETYHRYRDDHVTHLVEYHLEPMSCYKESDRVFAEEQFEVADLQAGHFAMLLGPPVSVLAVHPAEPVVESIVLEQLQQDPFHLLAEAQEQYRETRLAGYLQSLER